MVSFVVDGAEHSAVGVPPRRVVPGFDPVEHGEGQLLACLPAVLVEQLDLQGPKEALHGAVVEAVTDGAHGAEQPCGPESTTESPRRVLRSVVRMGHGAALAVVAVARCAICTASTTSSERM